MSNLDANTTVLIVPGLRDHVENHWQTLLAHRLPNVRTVTPLTTEKLSCSARVQAIAQALEQIDGPVILVAHSAGVLMTVHWAAQYERSIKGALLVAPPDLEIEWPSPYPSSETMRVHGWVPLPRTPLPFPSIVAGSSNDALASFESVESMARDWQATLVNLGDVGHLNPASGYGDWPQADAFIEQLDIQPTL
ncbi:RBBP9/YdeN family alpha/beta hydrolase [Parahaliea mediterranea]|uniref:RBBP9/YdeN family alpha/beta hydrolase n=1 Tax=Parahaliea mediterranea TaxID=651086 RepID=UPI000E2F4B1A|nr:alpha/beta fold hydrolase [Parahaliea mediterranea]